MQKKLTFYVAKFQLVLSSEYSALNRIFRLPENSHSRGMSFLIFAAKKGIR